MRREDTTEEEYYGLTSKQIAFAREYLKTGNITKSYMATYNTKSSINSVSGQASKVYNNPKVQAYIRDKQHQAFEQARAEDRDVMGVVDVLEWLTSVIKSNSRAIKMADRLKAADMILRASGAYIQKIEADVNSTNDIVINITKEEDDE